MFFPRVFIEITNICNLSCVYCPGPLQKREKQFMDLELFKKIIDDLFSNHKTERIDFHILGEALLHKEFFNMISYIRSRQKYPVTLNLATNGILLIKHSTQEALMNSSLDMIGISIRAKDKYEYKLKANEDILPGYEDYIESIRSFVRKVHEEDTGILISLGYFHTINSPYTLFSSYPFITKKSQVLSLVQYWHESIKEYKQAIPPKKVKLPFSLKTGWNYENNVSLSKNLELRIEGLGIWHNPVGTKEYFIKDASQGKCSLSGNLNISSAGNVVGCCLDFDSDINFGNLRDSTITDIITAKKHDVFKENIEKGILTTPLCRRCQGTIIEKASGRELNFKLPKVIQYYYLFMANPGRFVKATWNKCREKYLKKTF